MTYTQFSVILRAREKEEIMRNLGIGIATGFVMGVLMMALFKTLVLFIVIGLAIVGAFTLYVAVTKKSGSSQGG